MKLAILVSAALAVSKINGSPLGFSDCRKLTELSIGLNDTAIYFHNISPGSLDNTVGMLKEPSKSDKTYQFIQGL